MADSTFSWLDSNSSQVSTPEEDRVQRLEQAKQKKLDYLSKTNNMASLEDSYTDFGDGVFESNRNKIWNELNPQEIQSVQAYGLNQYGLTPDEEGTLRFASGEAYDGPTRRLYSFNTPEGEYKYGTARGDLAGSELRYTPNEKGTYGWKPGPRGVDVNQKNQDILLPQNIANILEGLAHGRRGAFDARSVRDIYTDPDLKTPYGSGVSEYYTSQEGLFGAAQEIDSAKGKELLDQYIQTFQERFPEPLTREERVEQTYRQLQALEADNADFGDRVANTAASFGSTFVNELFVRPAEAVGDLTGLYDISGTTDKVSEAFGYNPVLEQRAMEDIGKDWDVIVSDEASVADKVRAAMNGMFTAFTTPEMLGSSLGVIAAWTVPGGFLGRLGVGSKYAAQIAKIDKALEAGDLTKNAARLQKMKAFRSVEGTTDLLRKQSGHIVAAVGNVNEQYNEFVKNNGGIELEGADKAKWFAQRLPIQIVNQNLDKLVAMDVIKSPSLVKSLIPMAKSFTNKEFANIAKQAAKGVLVSAKDAGEEAAQEYTQTMMELFNSRYGSEAFKDQDTFKEFLADKRNLSEAGVAALAGAGGAGQFEVAGAAGPVVGAVGTGVGAAVETVRKKEDTEAIPETEASNAQVASEIRVNTQRAATSGNPASSYFSAFGSENAEARTTASQTAQQTKKELLEGSHTVFSSDAAPEEQVKQLKALVTMVGAEDGDTGSVEELSAAVIAQVKPATPEQEAMLAEEIKKAYQAGQQFASIKPMTEVEGEVSDGVRGFRTYYTQAYSALVEGDDKEYEKALGQLDRFYNHQQVKLNRVSEGVKTVIAEATAKANELVRRGKAKDFQTAVEQLRDEAAKKVEKTDGERDGKRIYHNDKKSNSTLVSYLDVYRKLASPAYDAGVFKWMKQVQSEVTAMGDVYTSLIGNIDTPAPTTEATASAEPVDETVTPEGEIPDSVDVPPAPDMNVDVTEEDLVAPPPVDQDIEDLVEDEFVEAPPEDFTAETDDAFTETVPEDYTATEDEFTESDTTKKPRVKIEKDEEVQAFEDHKTALEENQAAINERRDQIRRENDRVTKDMLLKDPQLIELYDTRLALKEAGETFNNTIQTSFLERVKSFTDEGIEVVVQLYKNFSGGVTTNKPVTTLLQDLVDGFTTTGFTLSERNRDDVLNSTKEFAKQIRKAIGVNTNPENAYNYKTNPLLAFTFKEDGTTNYNTIEAMQAATYEYLMQEASNLKSGYKTDEEIAELLGVPEEKLPTRLASALRQGGVTLKLASAAVGEKVITNLGLEISNVQQREALATSFGIVALQGVNNTLIENYNYSATNTDKGNGFLASDLRFVLGAPKFFSKMKKVRKDLNYFEDKYNIIFDKERTYRKDKRAEKRSVNIHRVAHQEAPKDHQEVVNKLENTAFSFNSGHSVLMSLFGSNGELDIEALTTHIVGPKTATTFDAAERYEAQKEAFLRSVQFYQEAKNDVGEKELYFNWFIAKNHRIHLDSNRINPQSDKHLARWLLTANNSRTTLTKEVVRDVLDGKSTDMQATMFVYGLVQAFDGVAGVPGIDKDNQTQVLEYAKELLDKPESELKTMAREAQHLGHAALAIANIAKYNEVGPAAFESDMVLEVDGLTNGFAFRSMQFPVASEGSDITPEQWLEKVGFIPEKSDLYSLESMNGARELGQEDVYISVGSLFNKAVAKQKKSTKDKNIKGWVKLLEQYPDGGLPDFSEESNTVKSFVRKLMKSPVMVFNYAAGIGKIASGLVDDQVMGTGYLSGQGLIDVVTAKDDQGQYKITKEQLVKVFGDKGATYHQARIDLATMSLMERGKGSQNIAVLRRDLYATIDKLYREPLQDTLETLFSKQTAINSALTNAAQFMYEHFKKEYYIWRDQNQDATDQDKIEFLKDIASIIPGVAGASSDDQRNKITFLKNVLDATNNDVLTILPGMKAEGRFTANTVARSYGDPGVGPAVLTVLSLDSSVMAKSLNQAYKGREGDAALPVHDAIVLGIGEAGTINSYNENFYTTNRNYSIIQEFVNAIDQLSKVEGMLDSTTEVGAEKNKEQLDFRSMQNTLNTLNVEVQKARQKLFEQNVKVGQLVGPEGTMVQINIEQQVKKSAQYIQKQANAISAALNTQKVKNAFGKDYNSIKTKIEDMIKGCK